MRAFLAGLTALTTLSALLLAGCEVGAPSTVQEAPVARIAEPTIEPWPFNVTSVVLACENPGRKVFVTTADGQRYAVNGSARSDAPLMRDIQAEMNLGPLIEMGLGLCDRGQGPLTLVAPPPQVEAPGGAAPIAPMAIEPAGYGDTMHISLQSDQLIAGQRSTLTVACKPDGPPMILFDLVTRPGTPPPLRGVYATIDAGDGPQSVEMSYGAGVIWTFRSGDTRELDTRLVRTLLESNRFEMQASNRYMPRTRLVWRVQGAPEDMARFRSLCG